MPKRQLMKEPQPFLSFIRRPEGDHSLIVSGKDGPFNDSNDLNDDPKDLEEQVDDSRNSTKQFMEFPSILTRQQRKNVHNDAEASLTHNPRLKAFAKSSLSFG